MILSILSPLCLFKCFSVWPKKLSWLERQIVLVSLSPVIFCLHHFRTMCCANFYLSMCIFSCASAAKPEHLFRTFVVPFVSFAPSCLSKIAFPSSSVWDGQEWKMPVQVVKRKACACSDFICQRCSCIQQNSNN
jgi:hypothetical protein